MKIVINTVVDITETKRNRNDNTKEYKQQTNFNTLLQTVGMKVNPYYSSSPVLSSVDVDNLGFGSNIKGEHNVWTFTIDIEYSDGISLDDLTALFDIVPIAVDLDETVKINKNVFHTKSKKYKNIVFTIND